MEDVGDLSALNGMGMDLANVGLPIMPNVLAAPVPRPGEEVKKERKKRQHDPNAPKRPLTPYFLYMQTARPIIADDLGADAAKGAVQEEGQRRWSTMSAREKAVSRQQNSLDPPRFAGTLTDTTQQIGMGSGLPVQPEALQCPCALVQERQPGRQGDE